MWPRTTARFMRWNRLHPVILLWALFALASTEASQAQAPFVHKKKYVMGTVFEIVAYGKLPEQASDAIDQAFREIVRLDDLMSDYKPDSALSRLNRSSHSRPQSVPPDLYRVIGEALEYSRLSQGKFDVTVGPLVNLWKDTIRGGPTPASAVEEKARACVGYQKVELLPQDRVRFHSPCVQIDLGAIGKGYALDRAADVLRSHGIAHALLDAGGSTIVAMGAPPGQTGWLVHLRDPSNKVDPQVILADSSVSTSEQTPPSLLERASAGHIIDPNKGVPVKTPFAVSAVANSGTASDALSTTLLLVGPERGKELVKNVMGVAAIWVSSDGQTQQASSGPRILLGNGTQGGAASIQTGSGGTQ